MKVRQRDKFLGNVRLSLNKVRVKKSSMIYLF